MHDPFPILTNEQNVGDGLVGIGVMIDWQRACRRRRADSHFANAAMPATFVMSKALPQRWSLECNMKTVFSSGVLINTATADNNSMCVAYG